MRNSSIFHFFARLVSRRGYFFINYPLREFPFPRRMVAVESLDHFPDLVLKVSQDDDLSGGELIAHMDSDSYDMPSFGSIPPTTTKLIKELSDEIVEALKCADGGGASREHLEFPNPLPERDVYYLVRGPKKTKIRRLYKVVLVNGAFFDTLATDQLLASAASQVAGEASQTKPATTLPNANLVVQQSDIEALHEVEGASISVRFEPEFNAVSDVNLLSDDLFPMITDDTLTLLVPEDGLPSNTGTTEQYWWCDAPTMITSCVAFVRLQSAYASLKSDLRCLTKLSILRHPISGPFFMAQVTLRTSSMGNVETCPRKLWTQG